jgi:VWFA-related protein
MRKLFAIALVNVLLTSVSVAQTPQKPREETAPDDVIRISTSLIQTDVVVTDKDDRIIPDLKLSDFKVYESGKQQELRFMEFFAPDAGPRLEGEVNIAGQPVAPDVARNLSAKELRRVFAFVVDDLTVPLEDVVNVRKMLTDFVDNEMRQGDLVAIVRVVGGNGLLQQFTSDKAILRRAIAQITPALHNLSAFDNLTSPDKLSTQLMQAVEAEGAVFPAEAISADNTNLDNSTDGINRGFRALATLSTANEVTNSMRTLPGRKSLVLISGGLPLSEQSPTQITVDGMPITVMETRYYLGNVSFLLRQLIDHASRAGVVINTLDIRGLKASRGVSRFTDPGNEATSALFGGATGGGAGVFGRTPNMAAFDNLSLDTMSSHLGLKVLAESTGGVSVVNSNNFPEGLARIMARSSYYILAYTPSEPFDNKYHKLEIKVNRPGAHVYSREGYFATPDPATPATTRESAIVRAAMSPLAKNEVDVAGRLQYKYLADSSAEMDLNLLINANNLQFTQTSDGRYTSSFDVVGFLVNSLGKTQGGFSQTVTPTLTAADYKRALANGISFTGHAQLPPGSYQLRAVVRETSTGRLGSMSQYIEVPDLSKKHLTASSLFLYAVNPADNKPDPLTALRQLPRQSDLRYAAIVYNPKVSDGKTQLRFQAYITRGSRIVFKSPEEPLTTAVQDGQVIKIGQLSLAKAAAGRYVLTLVITDPGAKKEERTIARSVDFNLID